MAKFAQELERELAEAQNTLEIVTATLTRAQEECTALVLENRKLKAELDRFKARVQSLIESSQKSIRK